MPTGTYCHFGLLLQVSKTISLKPDFIHLFHDFIHVYSPGAGADSRGQSVDVNRNVLSLHSFVASFKKMSLKSDFIHFFYDLIHVYSPGSGADSLQGTILMSTERPYHFTHLLHVSKKSL